MIYFLYDANYNPICDDNGEIIIYKNRTKANQHANNLDCHYFEIAISDLISMYCNVQQTLVYLSSTKFYQDRNINVSDIFHRLQGK
jgi:hypothetical protein